MNKWRSYKLSEWRAGYHLIRPKLLWSHSGNTRSEHETTTKGKKKRNRETLSIIYIGKSVWGKNTASMDFKSSEIKLFKHEAGDLHSSFHFRVSLHRSGQWIIPTPQSGRDIVDGRIELVDLGIQGLSGFLQVHNRIPSNITHPKGSTKQPLVVHNNTKIKLNKIKKFCHYKRALQYLQAFIIIYWSLCPSETILIFIKQRSSNLGRFRATSSTHW